VRDASLQGVTLLRPQQEITATLVALPQGGRLQTNGAKEVRRAPCLFTHLLLGGALREYCKVALWGQGKAPFSMD
jgi:hypothetical protein